MFMWIVLSSASYSKLTFVFSHLKLWRTCNFHSSMYLYLYLYLFKSVRVCELRNLNIYRIFAILWAFN